MYCKDRSFSSNLPERESDNIPDDAVNNSSVNCPGDAAIFPATRRHRGTESQLMLVVAAITHLNLGVSVRRPDHGPAMYRLQTVVGSHGLVDPPRRLRAPWERHRTALVRLTDDSILTYGSVDIVLCRLKTDEMLLRKFAMFKLECIQTMRISFPRPSTSIQQPYTTL